MKQFLLLCAGLLVITVGTNSQDYWEPVNLPSPGTDVLLVRSDNTGLMVIGTPDQIYHSTDGGETWTPSVNWPGYMPKDIAFNSAHTLFVGSYLFGMYRSYDSGLTFESINNGLTVMIINCVLVTDNDDLLVGTPLGIFHSVNDGDDWSIYGTGLPNDYVMTLIQTGDGDLFCGTRENGIYKSTDGGATWTASGNGLPSNAEVTAMEFVPQGPVFAGIFPEGMYRSTNNGNSWEPFNDGLPFDKGGLDTRGYSIDRIAFMNYCLYCIIYLMGAYMIPIIFDASDSWIQVNGGLPEGPTTLDLAGAPGNMLYLAASDQGLFRKTYPVGLTEKPGENLWQVNVSPNPVHGVVTFTLHLPQPERVSVTIWNLHGIQCGEVFQGFLSGGTSTLTWETSGLPTGLYTYRLVGDRTVNSGKLIIL